MSKKKIPTLSDIVSGEVTVMEPEDVVSTPPIARQAVQQPVLPVQAATKPDRTSTTVYLPPEVKRQLEELWFAERRSKSQNDLFLEGIDRVFKNRGLPSIKELVKEDA